MTNPAELYARASDALNRGDVNAAFRLASQLVPMVPEHPGGHFILGVAALELRQLPVALKSLSLATRLAPDRPEYGAYLARGLAAAGLMRQAVETADAAASRTIGHPLTLDTLGVVYTQANAYAKAAPLFRRAAALQPEQANYRFNLATSLMYIGEMDEAEREYEACLERSPTYWKAHLALAQLRRQSQANNHIERLRGLLERAGGDLQGQLYVHLALAKELEDLGNYAQAFDHFKAGKSAGGRGRNYTSEKDARLFEVLANAFPEPQDTQSGFDTNEAIFVFGLPRSGTTLVERVLTSHPDVQSVGELPNFGLTLKRESNSRTAALLDEDVVRRGLQVDPQRLGQAYLESTRPGTGALPRFVDKLPHNFMYAGFITRALPNARIVCVRRNPMDTVLGNFRQLFSLAPSFYDYSFDVVDIARYYVLFDRLMSHWSRVFPGRIHEVSYEALVEDQEATTRKLLEHCGLSWDPRCLDFQSNPTPVATASVVQVRQPLNRSSFGRWRKYEPQLADARAVLENAGFVV